MSQPKQIFVLLVSLFSVVLLSFSTGEKPFVVISWNLKDFGKSKSDEEINVIANIVKDGDIVVVQEVVAGYGGAQAVARLSDALNRKGAQWDYTISDPTVSSAYKTERYAFLWKPSRVKRVGHPWLEQHFRTEIDREPFYATFSAAGREITLVNFHAITKSQQPEREVKYFTLLPSQYPKLNLLFCGDFNLPQSHTVFNPLKSMGYAPALRNQKTSLRQACTGGDCLASELDNIFYRQGKVRVHKAGIIPFYQSFATLQEAKAISDHVPILLEFSLN